MNKMKRSFMQIKIIAVVILLLSACSQEDEYVTKGENEIPSQRIEITVSARDFVTDGTPDTRATDNGKETTFEDGDRVGIIILDKKNNLIYDNIPYVYNNGNWTFDSNNDDGKGGCYYDSKATTFIVYYPYSRAADRVTGVNDLKARFAPKLNQSDIEDYRSSDLMMWSNSSLTFPVKELNAKLTHAFASIYLTLKAGKYVLLEDGIAYTGSYTPRASDISNISDMSLTIDNTVYIPFQATDGTVRCIIPTNITLSDIRCFYTIGGNTYGNSIKIVDEAVAVNTRYTCTPVVDLIYSLDNAHLGDFYCKNSKDEGYLIPGDVVLTDGQKTACLGIVMKVGKDDNGNWNDDCDYKLKDGISEMNTIHGYVLALYDANDGNTCKWGSYGTEVNTNKEKTTGFYGYKNTQAITSKGGSDLSTAFPPTYHATTGYENKYPAPTNSSGWFLPSAGQCQYWLNNRPTLLTQVKNATGNNSYNWQTWYWSSSEDRDHPLYDAWYVNINNGNVDDGSKTSYRYVRSCLAF